MGQRRRRRSIGVRSGLILSSRTNADDGDCSGIPDIVSALIFIIGAGGAAWFLIYSRGVSQSTILFVLSSRWGRGGGGGGDRLKGSGAERKYCFLTSPSPTTITAAGRATESPMDVRTAASASQHRSTAAPQLPRETPTRLSAIKDFQSRHRRAFSESFAVDSATTPNRPTSQEDVRGGDALLPCILDGYEWNALD